MTSRAAGRRREDAHRVGAEYTLASRMSFSVSCSECAARYSIPDPLFQSRFAGRQTTIQCKRCRAPIAVSGHLAPDRASERLGAGSVPPEPASSRRPTPPPWRGLRSISLASPPPAKGRDAPSEEWTSFESVLPAASGSHDGAPGGSDPSGTPSEASLHPVVVPAPRPPAASHPIDGHFHGARASHPAREGLAPPLTRTSPLGLDPEKASTRSRSRRLHSGVWVGLAAAATLAALWFGAAAGSPARWTAGSSPDLAQLQEQVAQELLRAESCWKDQPALSGVAIRVTFAPEGQVRSVFVEGASEQGVQLNRCIRSHLGSLRVGNLQGSELHVQATIPSN